MLEFIGYLVMGYVCIGQVVTTLTTLYEGGGSLPLMDYIYRVVKWPLFAIVLSWIYYTHFRGELTDSERKVLDYMGFKEHLVSEVYSQCGLSKTMAALCIASLAHSDYIIFRSDLDGTNYIRKSGSRGKRVRRYQPQELDPSTVVYA